MANPKVLTGAIALIKVKGEVVGKMRNVRVQENMRRMPVRGIGTILPSEQAVTEWDGTVSCDFIFINLKRSGIKGALRRDLPAIGSQVLQGNPSFEDQLVLDADGVQIDLFKKVADVVQADGTINPTAKPLAIIKQCFIDTDNFDVSEGGLAGKSQSFKYLLPAQEPAEDA